MTDNAHIPVVADNATIDDLGDEPEGFWLPIHEQVDEWVAKYGNEPD